MMKRYIILSLAGVLIVHSSGAMESKKLNENYAQLAAIMKPRAEPSDDADLALVKSIYSPELVRLFETKKGPLLYNALIFSSPEVAEFLLEQGVNPNTPNIHGETALMIAARQANLPLVKKLIAHKADPHFKNKKGQMAYDYANIALQENPFQDSDDAKALTAIMEYLQRLAPAQAVTAPKPLSLAEKSEKLLTIIKLPGEKDEKAELQQIKELYSPELVQLFEKQKGPLLVQVLLFDKPKIAEWLLEKGHNPNIPNSAGTTGLMLVAGQGDLPLVKKFIEYKADVALKDAQGRTAYDYAKNQLLETASDSKFAKELQAVMEYLKGLGAPAVKAERDVAAEAARQERLEKSALGFFHGPDDHIDEEFKKTVAALSADGNYVFKYVPTVKGKTLLYQATMREKSEVVTYLLERGANPNIQNIEDGETPLIIAAKFGAVSLVPQLLAKKADVSLKDKKGLTALDYARKKFDQHEDADARKAYAGIIQLLDTPKGAPVQVQPAQAVSVAPAAKSSYDIHQMVLLANSLEALRQKLTTR